MDQLNCNETLINIGPNVIHIDLLLKMCFFFENYKKALNR